MKSGVVVVAAKITDVAQKAGVAVSTVSRVFNNTGRISETTREKVLQVAENLAYHPRKYHRQEKAPARSLFVIYHQKINVLNNNFYSLIMEEVEHLLTENNYHLIFKTVTGDLERDHHIMETIAQVPKSGFILIGYEIAPEIIRALKKTNLPLILIDNVFLEEAVDCVVIDNFYGALQGVDHLLDLGHRRIGFIGGPLNHTSLNERYLGYRTALDRAGVTPEPAYARICSPDFGVENGYGAALEMLGQTDVRPTAIFAANDGLAIGVLKAARQLGISVPDQLSVLGFDDIDFATHTDPPLSTIRVFKRQIGREAAKRLVEMIDGASGQPVVKAIVSTELVIRQSTGKYWGLKEKL
ncbi:MAG TPA: LacI family DNA-binding transcriptional regulator [Bacillota bacterium]|nr:LacI family DNA-binding transcriptional regulator [Bacillota bacterium]